MSRLVQCRLCSEVEDRGTATASLYDHYDKDRWAFDGDEWTCPECTRAADIADDLWPGAA